MRTWPVALCAAILLALVVAIFSHRRPPPPAAGSAAVAIATPAAADSVGEASEPESGSATTQVADEGPKPMSLAIALLPAPGPADASRIPAGTDGDLVPADAGTDTLAGHVAARDAALAESPEEFFREAAEVRQQSPLPGFEVLPVLSMRQAVTTATVPTLALPLHAGRASLGWITHAIRDEHQLPLSDAVRAEEILNAFPLRPAGCAAICQGVSLTTESLPCPWKPSSTLLLVSIRGAADLSHDVTATFHATPATVARYRLLGFALPSGLNSGPLPTRIPPKSITSLVLEIEPSSVATAFGSLEWTLDGQPAAPIIITHHRAAEPSDDARFAILVCAFAQWLAHDPAALIDFELLAALVRENTSATLPLERTDFLALINEALAL